MGSLFFYGANLQFQDSILLQYIQQQLLSVRLPQKFVEELVAVAMSTERNVIIFNAEPEKDMLEKAKPHFFPLKVRAD